MLKHFAIEGFRLGRRLNERSARTGKRHLIHCLGQRRATDGGSQEALRQSEPNPPGLCRGKVDKVAFGQVPANLRVGDCILGINRDVFGAVPRRVATSMSTHRRAHNVRCC